MSVLIFVFFGFFVGLIARALTPGRQSLSIVMTTLLGGIGSLIGGLLGNMLTGDPVGHVHPAGMIGSVLGAIIVLAVTGVGRRHFA